MRAAAKLSVANEYITMDVIDAEEYHELTKRYEVSGTPKTIINETNSFEGAMPEEAAFLEILKAVKPELHSELEGTIEAQMRTGKAKAAKESHRYDMIIIGGGAAAMSAAVYAGRKELDILLISKSIGGQMTYTATIENYLGFSDVGGQELTHQFRHHMEQYPIAEALGANVTSIQKSGDLFTVKTEKEQRFEGHSILFCAGKEYRRLGVPGEERFIGNGVAFCATCDAPLYKGKKVAVVGGGNSAFTALRDLLGFASEIHLIHRRDTFKADPTLIDEAKKAKKITFHTSMNVLEILGKDKLTGIRLVSADGNMQLDLQVDGVFLEIGLIPNTALLKDFVDLSERGEIKIGIDNSTNVPGFFAAGDATIVPEKQIIIAAGEGAKAALSAYSYLKKNKLMEK